MSRKGNYPKMIASFNFKEHKVYFGIGIPNENEKYPSLSK